MLPTESILIKIFRFEHEARVTGSREKSSGDVLVTSLQAAGFGRAGQGAGVCSGRDPILYPQPRIPLFFPPFPPAGLDINSADLE